MSAALIRVILEGTLRGSSPLLITPFLPMLAPTPRWTVDRDGINWAIEASAPKHQDQIETSGEKCSLILTYGTGEGGALVSDPQVVWPMLRTLPNDTHASLRTSFPDRPKLVVNGTTANETLRRVRLDGVIRMDGRAGDLDVRRTWFVDRTQPFAIERLVVKNSTRNPIQVGLSAATQRVTEAAKGLQGAYVLEAAPWQGDLAPLAPGKSREMAVLYTAWPQTQPRPSLAGSPRQSEDARRRFVRSLDQLLDLETPDPDVNRMFRFAKVRAAESLFRTKGGLVHSPGGGAYYAAIWANDQAEYANPLFGYLGYKSAYEAAETSFDWFAQYMNDDYRPIPSSIIAEGTSYWNGAGDRGDMAMIAYGASRYALAKGDRKVAQKLWPLIEWSLEYLRRKQGPEGVILSDSDELEGRFPAGKANLNTSCLAYDALLSAAFLAEEWKDAAKAKKYRDRAAALHRAIESYFGQSVEGFSTYRYYDGNDLLRAWIATPLTVGIFDRATGTTDALFSPRLWTEDGLASVAGDRTFWDRATLYGFRGVFAAGATERAFPKFLDYTNRRLTGAHVPYAVEAYPEGNQRHLSAESALYVRAVTEGLFGIRPVGLHRVRIEPRLPAAWKEKGMSLRNVRIGGKTIDIEVQAGRCIVTPRGGSPQKFPLGRPIEIGLR